MAVQKMIKINVMGDILDVDNVLMDVLHSGKVDLVSAIDQIESNNFVFNVKDENLDKFVDLNYTTPFSPDTEYEGLKRKIEEIKTILDIEKPSKSIEIKAYLTKDELKREIENLPKDILKISEDVRLKKEKLKEITDLYNSFPGTSPLSIPLEDYKNLNSFDFKFGVLSKEDRIKLKRNYENILATVLHTASTKDGELYYVFYPSILREEMSRILRSLNFKEIIIPDRYKGNIREIKSNLEQEKSILEKEIESYQDTLIGFKDLYKESVNSLEEQVNIKLIIEDTKEQLAKSNNYFYLSGWIPLRDKAVIENDLRKYKDILIMFKDENDEKPPTKLYNNWFIRPFESLVKMYGMPSYNELDPTPFLSLSYMFLFGAMFGDLGQGFIVFLAGLIVSKKNKIFGSLLSRLGFSSMIFGVLYGAVFGFETIIPALLIKPFESINETLVAAVISGVILLLISYIYSMINCAKRGDLEEGLFGKEGLVGLIFYLVLLAIAGGKFLNKTIIPTGLAVVLITICLLAMVFKQPLTHIIKKKRPLHGEDISGYYVESVFSLLETLLSMLSGTVSFIRVGAFALTHVGLFVAFETIGEMIGNPTGNAVVLVVGNILILGLEGLIVFIQALRLQYYELFSRYYKGDGKEFNPVSMDNN